MIYFLRNLLVCLSFLSIAQSSWSQLTFTSPANATPPNTVGVTNYTLNTSLCQGEGVDHCLLVTSAGTTHTITSFTGNDGSIVIAPPSNPFPRCFRYIAPFGFTGTDFITFTVTNNLGQTGTITIGITVVNPATPINAGVNQELCFPTNFTTLSAIGADPLATGYWTKQSGTGVISAGFDSPAIPLVDQAGGPTVNVTNLSLGSNIFIWHQDYPCATKLKPVTIYVYSGTPPPPDANTCNPSDTIVLCGVNCYTMCANSPGVAATGTWEILSGAGTIYNINNPLAQVCTLAAGYNMFEWTISNGACPGGEMADTMWIAVYPSIQIANAGPDLSRCIGSFTNVTLTGNALVAPNTGQWTFVSGPVVPTLTPASAASATIGGLTAPGIYCFNWTITSGPCGSSTDQVCIYVYSPTTLANAGPDQNICLPNNNTTLAATAPPAPASGTWTVVAGTGAFATASSPNTTVSGLSVGINTFRWTLSNGPCANNNSFDEVTIRVFPVSQPTPDAGIDKSLCYTGAPLTTTLSANAPVLPGTGAWTIAPAGPTISPLSSPTATVTGLTTGSYTLTWTLSNGGCSPSTSDQMVINVYNGIITTTNAGPDQAWCTPTNAATMAATLAPAPSIGTWTVISGAGSIVSPNSPTSVITNLGVGCNVFRWTVNNGSCGSYFDEVQVCLYSSGGTTANAGSDQEFCAGAGPVLVTMGATPTLNPAVGTWTGPFAVVPANSPTGIISGLPVGTHNFTWTVNNGPCGTAQDLVQIRVFGPGQTAANAGADQQLCSTSNNTSLLANNLVSPATGVWTIVSGGGTFGTPNSPFTTVSNIPIGVNIYQWTIYNGPCTTPVQLTDQVIVTVTNTTQPAANAGADIEACSTQSTVQLNGNAVVFPATGLWTVVSGPNIPTIAPSNSPNAVVSGLIPGTYQFSWSINNGACGITSDIVQLEYFSNTQPPANAGLNQSICSPASSVTLAGNAVTNPAIGTWTVTGPNTPVFGNNHSPNTAVTGLIVGTYIFTWTIDNGACSPTLTFDDMIVEVFDNNQSAANAGADVEICEPVTEATITGNVLQSPATGIWTQILGPNTPIIVTPTLNQTLLQGLIVGTYRFQWTVTNGSCIPPTTSDIVEVRVYDDSQGDANAGADINICTPASSTTLGGNSIISPAVGTWTLVSGPNVPSFGNINNPTSSLSGLIVGTYVLEWTVDNGTCANGITADQVLVKVFQNGAPVANAGNNQSLCSPDDQAVMVANAPVGPATGLWTVVTGAGTFVDASSPTTLVTNIPVGQNCFQWTIDNGTCPPGVTFDVMCINVYSSNQGPADAGEDQDICTPQSNTTLDGNQIISPAVGTWVQISGPSVANIISPNAFNSDVQNLVVGCYVFRWTINNGVCTPPITFDDVQVCIYDSGFPPSDPGPDQELCSPASTTVMNASAAIAPGEGTWSASGPTVPVFADVNDPNTTVSNLGVGTYIFTWSLNYSACGSEANTMTVTVFNSAQGAADAGLDQILCTPTSTTEMNAEAVLNPAFGTWSVVSGSADIIDIHNPNTDLINLEQGTICLEWYIYNGGCLADELSRDTVCINLFDVNQLPAFAGADTSICSTSNCATVHGNGVTSPATGVWTVDQGSGAISDVDNTDTDVCDLPVGENIFCWTISNGNCIPPTTTDCVSVFVYDVDQPAADAGPNQDLCSSLTSCTFLAGNSIIFPAQGTWTVLAQPNGSTAIISDVNNPATEICGLIPGSYTLQWCIFNGPCGPITCDEMVITIYDQTSAPAEASLDVELCLPLDSLIMTGNPAILPGYGEWTDINTSGLVISNLNDPQTLIYDIPVGIQELQWCIYNGVCPNASTCDTVLITMYDPDAAPANAGSDQLLCDATSINLAAASPDIPGVGTWSVVPFDPLVSFSDIHNPSATVTGVATGAYVFEWQVYNGPCTNTNTTDQVTVLIYDSGQDAANAGDSLQICTPQSSVITFANNPIFPAIGYWTIVPGSSGIITDSTEAGTAISGLTPGISQFIWTIDNGPCGNGLTSDTLVVEIFDGGLPPVDAGADIGLCAAGIDPSPITTLNGSIVVAPAVGTWIQASGPTTAIFTAPNSNTTDVSGLAIGTYEFVWSVSNGTCGILQDTMLVNVYDGDAPVAEAGPDGFYCSPINSHTQAAIPATSPAVGTWEHFPNNPILPLNGTLPHDPFQVFTDIPIGQNLFKWTVNNGVCGSSFDFMSVFIYNELNPDADANIGPEIELCSPQEQVNMNALEPIFPALGIWSQVDGCNTIAIDQVGSFNSLISGLCIGTQCFQWEVDNGPCPQGITRDTVCIRVFPPLVTVEVSDDIYICTPEDSVTVSGTIPEDPNYGTWVNIQGGGTIESPDSASTVISDLPVGINCFTWSFYNGPCNNFPPSDTVCVWVYDEGQPPADAGELIELCEPIDSTPLNANSAIFPAEGSWTIIAGGGIFTDQHDPQTTITNLQIGINTLVWTINNGPCQNPITSDTVNVVVYPDINQFALGGNDVNLCNPDGFIILEAVDPTPPAYGYWEVIDLGGGLISDTLYNNAVITLLPVGEFSLVWHVYNGPCNPESVDSVSVFQFDNTALPASAGPDQEFCSPVDSVFTDANAPIFPASGTWTVVSYPGNIPPDITNSSDPLTSVTGLNIGTTVLLWEIDNGPCGITTDSLLIDVFDPLSPSAILPPDVYLCDPPECVDLIGNQPTDPSYGWWDQIAGDTLVVISDTSAFNTQACNLALNESAFVWHIYNGPCPNSMSSDTIWFYINDSQVANANAGPDSSFCGSINQYVTQGSQLVGTTQGLATGTWTPVSSGGIVITNPESPEATITNIPLGVSCYAWTVDNNACGITSDTLCLTLYDQNLPQAFAGLDSAICEHLFASFALSASPANAPALGEWEIIEGPISISNPLDSNALVNSIGEIQTELLDVVSSLIWSVDNGVCGSSSDTLTITLRDCLTLKIPDAISPNGDGVNDTFVIPNIQSYPNNSLQIFNRWGALIFQANNYQNQWDGRSSHAATLGEELPVSTYYYVLDLGNGENAYSGFVYLKR
jgi:gliding motility-associated-like protein